MSQGFDSCVERMTKTIFVKEYTRILSPSLVEGLKDLLTNINPIKSLLRSRDASC